MELFEVQNRTEELIAELCQVWEQSVRATHLFLSESEILNIAGYVPSAIKEIPRLVIAVDDGNKSAAFMGIENGMLEMLFVAPKERGRGLGKQLIQYGISHYSVNRLNVNEQNHQARGFYEHMGFRVYKRMETDEQGGPYPVLYMRRSLR